MSFKATIFTTSDACAAAHVLADPRRDRRAMVPNTSK